MPESRIKRSGEPCPKLMLGTGDERVSIEELFKSGPLVVIFYSGDFSPHAITQLCRFNADHAMYKDAGMYVIALGSGNEATRTAFIKKYELVFPLYHDAKKAAAKAFGVTKKVGNRLIIQPHVFVIGTNGKICHTKSGYPKCSEILRRCR